MALKETLDAHIKQAMLAKDKVRLTALRSLKSQIIHLETLNLTVEMAAGETIRSEISRKFDGATLRSQLDSKGLRPLKVWMDANEWFGLLLCHCEA